MSNLLKKLRKQKGLTQQQVADQLGLALPNYNNLENGRTELTVTRINKLAEILDCEPVDFLVERMPTRQVDVVAFVQAGQWAESNELEVEDQYSVAVPHDAEFSQYRLTGAEVRGPSMNLRYPEGTILVITNAIETREDIQPGKRYVVERHRADGMHEYTVKTLHRDEDGHFWLVPESNDPRHQQPIKVNGDLGDTIRILGRVVYAVSRES